MKRLLALILMCALLTLAATSCSQKEKPSCRELVEILTNTEISLPAGSIFSLSAKEGENEYASDSLLSALYGNGEIPPLRECWIDGAMFLSSNDHPCEFAVILCNSHDAATDTARLLCRRIDAIRTTKNKPEYKELIENATVTVRGNYVVFIISSDSKSAFKAIKKVLQ